MPNTLNISSHTPNTQLLFVFVTIHHVFIKLYTNILALIYKNIKIYDIHTFSLRLQQKFYFIQNPYTKSNYMIYLPHFLGHPVENTCIFQKLSVLTISRIFTLTCPLCLYPCKTTPCLILDIRMVFY